MSKKVLILILVWFIVAGFFYAAIWTIENNTLSERLFFTGVVAVFQIIITCISYLVVALVYEEKETRSVIEQLKK